MRTVRLTANLPLVAKCTRGVSGVNGAGMRTRTKSTRLPSNKFNLRGSHPLGERAFKGDKKIDSCLKTLFASRREHAEALFDSKNVLASQ